MLFMRRVGRLICSFLKLMDYYTTTASNIHVGMLTKTKEAEPAPTVVALDRPSYQAARYRKYRAPSF